MEFYKTSWVACPCIPLKKAHIYSDIDKKINKFGGIYWTTCLTHQTGQWIDTQRRALDG